MICVKSTLVRSLCSSLCFSVLLTTRSGNNVEKRYSSTPSSAKHNHVGGDLIVNGDDDSTDGTAAPTTRDPKYHVAMMVSCAKTCAHRDASGALTQGVHATYKKQRIRPFVSTIVVDHRCVRKAGSLHGTPRAAVLSCTLRNSGACEDVVPCAEHDEKAGVRFSPDRSMADCKNDVLVLTTQSRASVLRCTAPVLSNEHRTPRRVSQLVSRPEVVKTHETRCVVAELVFWFADRLSRKEFAGSPVSSRRRVSEREEDSRCQKHWNVSVCRQTAGPSGALSVTSSRASCRLQ